MNAVKDRIYQPSDLAGNDRKNFIADALESRARLRTTTGEALVMVRESELEFGATMREHAVAYLTLDIAMRRDRDERRASDYGDWAFIRTFDDEDIEDFRIEINDAIVIAASQQNLGPIDSCLHAWRMSARTMASSAARAVLEGTEAEEMVDATPLDAGA